MFARKIVGATSGILLWHAPKTPVELMAGGDDILKGHLRQALMEQAQTGTTTTYRELAQRLGLEPPHTIHRVTEALEWLMEDDVAAGRPILSAICVSKTRPNIPARGFFLAAQGLGIYSGDPSGHERMPSTHASYSEPFHSMEPCAKIPKTETERGKKPWASSSG